MNKEYNILVYTSNNCTFCNSAKDLLKRKRLKYKEINVSLDDSLKEKMIKEILIIAAPCAVICLGLLWSINSVDN